MRAIDRLSAGGEARGQARLRAGRGLRHHGLGGRRVPDRVQSGRKRGKIQRGALYRYGGRRYQHKCCRRESIIKSEVFYR